jgi:hypothetical protein
MGIKTNTNIFGGETSWRKNTRKNIKEEGDEGG